MRRRLRLATAEQWVALVLALLTGLIVFGVWMWPDSVPFTALYAPLVLGAFLLGPRLLVLLTFCVVAALVAVTVRQEELTTRAIGAIAVLSALCLVAVLINTRRATSGIGLRRGETMLVDLRDRIVAQGAIPELPQRWLVESALSSAGGSPFAGDFVVATKRDDGTRLEVAVVDVSGKGEAAGTRALQLSGAMGGLLGALPADRFLPAANDYLLQREWEEGFATAVHLSLDLTNGAYELRTAGHPPAVQRFAGSGRWQVLRTDGPVLGLLDKITYEPMHGWLRPGDALLLYTDGMVERPRRDIELGIDSMLGVAEQLCRRSFDGLADRLAAKVGSLDDDRALVLVHQRVR